MECSINNQAQSLCTARECSPLRRTFIECSINNPALSLCTARQCSPLRRTFMECSINNPALSLCTARQCSPLSRKFMECPINNPALSLLMKHVVIGQRLKTPNFSAFHWSPRGSLVSIGQHFVATRVVHLLKSTKTSLITNRTKADLITSYCSYARPAQPGPIRIAVIAGLSTR